jgi:choline dehydrogenase-like flavoprotein
MNNPLFDPSSASEPHVDEVENRLEEGRARDKEHSEFDYIIVGSGAGGGPLAARLAEAGKKVLVIEAGRDPAKTESRGYPAAQTGEVTKVPGYYGAASEDGEMSWMFSVRHYADTDRQKLDKKYNESRNPDTGGDIDPKYRDRPDGPKQGVFYPRSSGIGGCTAHHAMITIAPNDKEWNYIAEVTGDNSWRPGPMRGYFAKFERCQYLAVYDQFFQKLLGLIYRLYRRIVLLFDPRAILDQGGHGFKGWAPTNLIDPFLVSTIAKTDRPFFRVIVQAALAVLHGNNRLLSFIQHGLLRLRVVQTIDFNDLNTRRASPEGVFLIPIGIEGGCADDGEGEPGKGRRFGVREFLLTAQRRYPDRLVIRSGAHVTRVLFEKGEKEGDAPRAIGVECAVGDYLYEASPVQQEPPKKRVCYFANKTGGEVILCGGAFNTPQLLMLSGIGDAEHLGDKSITGLFGATVTTDSRGNKSYQATEDAILPVINLPGVGANLQDRYEVTVVSELSKPLASLNTVSFKPGDPNDKARAQWFAKRTGLYATNGGTLAVIRRSQPAKDANEPEPDLFTFGAPAAFRGYYWNWSRELFKATLGATEEEHKIWSWVILKAYTSNHRGTVRLRSNYPFALPEICFDAFNEQAQLDGAKIARDYRQHEQAGRAIPAELAERKRDNDARLEDSKRDLAAVMDAVDFMRKVNARNPDQFVREIQPGVEIKDYSTDMEEWVKTQAWGHHASCTCRMGSDKWQADPRKILDKCAVLDSRFKVHGVDKLRVVDASVFPKIPGYFILAPIFMMSEKAADTLLEDAYSRVYPAEFKEAEANAVRERRRIAHPKPTGSPEAREDESRLPDQTVGLALTGGGVRSATFALGVLQTLSKLNRLRDVDFLSTVSGGGFTGSFLGRLFTRPSVSNSKDPVGRVQDILSNSRSPVLWWLRTQANYIFATSGDARLNLAVFWRNIFALHLVLAALLFTLFGFLAWLPRVAGPVISHYGSIRLSETLAPLFGSRHFRGLELSAWWWLPVLTFGIAVVPATLGYWLAPNAGSYRRYPIFSLFAWLVLVAGAAAGLYVPHFTVVAGGALGVLLLAWIWQEVARWGAIPDSSSIASAQKVGSIVRNRLSKALGETLVIFAMLTGWVVLDTVAIRYAQGTVAKASLAILVALGPALPLLRWIGMNAARQVSGGLKNKISYIRIATYLGLPLALFALFVLDVLAHWIFIRFPASCISLVLLTGAFSAVLGRAIDFLNLSSLRATYASRLSRTFLGASNEARIYGSPTNEGRDVSQANPDDDIPHDKYHPERNGGPLHLINVCVNETVDVTSEREVRERKGLPMCITPHGISVGLSYFSRWTAPDAQPWWQKWRRHRDGYDAEDDLPASKKRPTAVRALSTSSDPNAFHVLKSTKTDSAEVEKLSLAAWTSISGAAFSTGVGRNTKESLSLFMGLLNIRLGYWWDSGILPSERPGRYPPSFWRMIKRFPSKLFGAQSMLLAEIRGRFRGPSQWFWYLSDGGHFEVTGLYELLRRRVRFMIVPDGGEDPDYRWSDISLLMQQAREDFGVEIEWIGQEAFNAVASGDDAWIGAWINKAEIGLLADIKREGPGYASLARATYSDGTTSWILMLKPTLAAGLTQDILNYGTTNKSFPQDPTFDQVFDDIQWESYRALGQQIAENVFRQPDPHVSPAPPAP